MRKLVFMLIILLLPTLACSMFGGQTEEGAPTQISETEVVGGDLATETQPAPAVPTETPGSVKPPEDEIPIEPKPTESGAVPTPAITEAPATSREEGLAEEIEELFFPYEVAQYQNGVKISVFDFRAFQATYSETENFIGIIVNSGTVDLVNLTVYVIALDENGEELASAHNLADLEDFPVGGKMGFSVSSTGEGFPDNTDHLLIAFGGYLRQDWHTPTQDIEVLSSEGTQEEDIVWDTVYNLRLTFRNDSGLPIWLVKTNALLYNRDGRLIGTCIGQEEEKRRNVYQPGDGDETGFECVFVYGIVDHFELIVEGDEAPET